jgi:peptide/nickel transport system substrate-binding protein
MGDAATRVTARAALDDFFAAYYRRRPVTATFTGVHQHDFALPDWSRDGLDAAVDEMRALRRGLAAAGCPRDEDVRAFPDDVDLALADGFLEIQIVEHESGGFYRGNAALWTGEAIFGVLSLVTRDFAPIAERLDAATARLEAMPGFLRDARDVIESRNPDWDARARRECAAAVTLLGESLPAWANTLDVPSAVRDRFVHASARASAAYGEFETWLNPGNGRGGHGPHTDGTPKGVPYVRGHGRARSSIDPRLLLRRGHWTLTSPADLLIEARDALDEATSRLDAMARAHGGWLAVQDALANQHPTVNEYLPRFRQIWDTCRSAAEEHDLVTWPEAPIRYVPIPLHTRAAAPHLYYLFYRSPAAFDRVDVYDYVVTPIDRAMPESTQAERLRAMNDSVIKLNHVVHHGGIGHHVQNHHAYKSRSRIGQVAATDAASRIGMFAAGTMAEGWACYVCDLMEEVELLTPLESVAQQHTRVRLAARAVVDLAMHTSQMTVDEAASLYRDRASMSAPAARAEAVKNSMFPCAAVMYWLGTNGLHALRSECSKRQGATFSLRRFHDQVLSYGSIPVPLMAKLLLSTVALVLCVACGAGQPLTRPAVDTLIVGYDREPDTLNRFSTHILEDIQTCVIEGLVTTDEEMRIVPLLATEVPTLENKGVVLRPDGGMNVTWKLRPNVKWHDGTPFTSADVQFTVDAINDPTYNPESTDGFDRISHVDAPDPLTAIVHYKEVYAPYALQFVRGTLPKHVLQGRDIDSADDYNRAPLGTGPYRVAEWRTGEYIRLERAPNHWRGTDAAKIGAILFKFVPNTNTRINQLKSGEVHMVAMMPWDKYREVSAIANVTVHRTPGNAYEHVTLNQRQVPAFRDVRVRQALTHAVDRELIVKTILEGLAPVTNGPIQPVSWAYTPDVRTYAFDPARARALLEESGWHDGNGDGIREKDGRPLSFTLITQAGFAVREVVSQVLQRQFRDVGADVRIQLHDGTSISQLWFEGKFDAMLHWWQMPADPELTLFFAKDRTPPRGRNINYVDDDELTTLVYAADRTVDRMERTRLLHQAQARIADLAVEIPLYGVTKLDAIPTRLVGFKGNPTNTGPFWNVHEWQLR